MKRMMILSVLAGGALLYGQDARIPLSDPGRPAMVKVSLVEGSIHVQGYNGKEVIVTTKRNSRPPEPDKHGMHRIDQNAGFVAEEQNNVVNVVAGGPNVPGSLYLQVPTRSNLQLSSVNGGQISVESVEGEMDVRNVNGSVKLNNVAGAVVANSTNGSVVVDLDRVAGEKPMAFSTLNGSVDVTLPADVKANVKMKSDNGDIYTDFDIRLTPNTSVSEDRTRDGKHRIRVDHTITGTINGGGPEIRFTTLNGRITLRKGK